MEFAFECATIFEWQLLLILFVPRGKTLKPTAIVDKKDKIKTLVKTILFVKNMTRYYAMSKYSYVIVRIDPKKGQEIEIEIMFALDYIICKVLSNKPLH